MKIEIVKCPSGFYAVLVNGTLWDGACVSKEHAEKVAGRLIPANGKEGKK